MSLEHSPARQGMRPACFTIDEFCDTHRISRAMFYKLLKQGIGPDMIQVGVKRLITVEAAARWRAERETVQSPID